MRFNSFAAHRPWLPAALLLLSPLATHPADAAPPAPCAMRLVVELTPDVPDPRDEGFLSSLLNNQTDYALSWVGRVGGSTILLDLNGPGPSAKCHEVVATMRHDGRVLSISDAPDAVPSLSVQADRAPPLRSADFSVSPYGLGAVYWAARHPAQAWRIVLP